MKYLKKFGKKLVFNNHNYSVTTNRHIHVAREWLKDNGIKIDLEIEDATGLTDLSIARKSLENKIKLLVFDINKPRSNKKKNISRTLEIKELMNKLKLLNRIRG